MELHANEPLIEKQQLSTALFNRICRACLSSEETVLIFDVTYQDTSLCDIFKNCVSLQIDQDDKLPQNICKSCIAVLVQIHTFKLRCQQSDALLRDISNRDHSDTDLSELKPARASRRMANLKSYVENPDCQAKCRKQNGYEKKIKNNSDTYYCKYCNETFDSYSKLQVHRQKIKHPRPRNNACPECHKLFSNSHLQQHMRTHTKEKPFPCHVCQMQFSLKCNLRRHMMIHTGERPHTCDVCGKGFIQATTLEDHKRTHTGEMPFVCSYCGMSFRQSTTHKSHLRRHLLENGDLDKLMGMNNECDVCHRRFTTRGILKTHMLTHGEKTFLCSQCGKGFVSNAGLLSHSKVHTGVKPYMCTVCNKAFSQLGSLKSHMLIHTGQKPFVCKVCSKAFTQRNHLKYHTRIHSGERPYSCSYCSKSFALKGTLTIHIRTHTGETPYLCDICNKGFYDSSSMKKHRRGHGQTDERSSTK